MEMAPLIIHMVNSAFLLFLASKFYFLIYVEVPIQISTVGFITNTIALITIYRSPRLQSTFGFLCAISATGNIIILTMYSTWYSLPKYKIFEFKSILSRYVGIIGVSIWALGFRLHLLIAFNRMVALVFPLASYKYANKQFTLILLAIGIVIAFIQAAPLIFIEEAWFCYEPNLMMWIFAPSKWGVIYERYFNNLPSKIEFVATISMDSITMFHLRLMKKNKSPIDQQKARKLEIKLFFQSVSKIFPFVFCFTFFEYVTPTLETDFGRFLSTTAVWHAVHAADGLIIDIFHTKIEIFSSKKQSTIVIQPASPKNSSP